MIERDDILEEIRRIAKKNGGKPPGVRAFTAGTGISYRQWCGIHWARWSDALADAGFEANEKQSKFDSEDVLKQVALLALEKEAMPTDAEMRMRRRSNPSFPSSKTVENHFGSKAELQFALLVLGKKDNTFDALRKIIPEPAPSKKDPSLGARISDGWVYMLKSGLNYKIGRGEQLERRVKQIATAMPDATILTHAIRTDDPAGIEAYWHRRFKHKRLNGEWFKLDPKDVLAFKRRKFQ